VTEDLVCLRSFVQYGVMAEILAHAGHIGPEVVNCSAPDTGNMGVWIFLISTERRRLIIVSEVLARYGSPEQQKEWLLPLLNGDIRSAFAMTEKGGKSVVFHLFVSRLDDLSSRFVRCDQYPDFDPSGGQ